MKFHNGEILQGATAAYHRPPPTVHEDVVLRRFLRISQRLGYNGSRWHNFGSPWRCSERERQKSQIRNGSWAWQRVRLSAHRSTTIRKIPNAGGRHFGAWWTYHFVDGHASTVKLASKPDLTCLVRITSIGFTGILHSCTVLSNVFSSPCNLFVLLTCHSFQKSIILLFNIPANRRMLSLIENIHSGLAKSYRVFFSVTAWFILEPNYRSNPAVFFQTFYRFAITFVPVHLFTYICNPFFYPRHTRFPTFNFARNSLLCLISIRLPSASLAWVTPICYFVYGTAIGQDIHGRLFMGPDYYCTRHLPLRKLRHRSLISNPTSSTSPQWRPEFRIMRECVAGLSI